MNRLRTSLLRTRRFKRIERVGKHRQRDNLFGATFEPFRWVQVFEGRISHIQERAAFPDFRRKCDRAHHCLERLLSDRHHVGAD